MSLTVRLYKAIHCDCGAVHDTEMELYSANISHNYGQIAKSTGLYYPLWRPDEIGIHYAGELIEPLTKGLAIMRKVMKDSPGFGYLLSFTAAYLVACMSDPEAVISISR